MYIRQSSLLSSQRCSVPDIQNTVSGVDTGSLNVLHDTTESEYLFLTVAYRVDLDLFTLTRYLSTRIWMILCNPVDDSDKFINIVIIDRNLHTLSAKYVRRSYQYRVTQSRCATSFGFFCSKYSSPGRSWNLALFSRISSNNSLSSAHPHLLRKFQGSAHPSSSGILSI